MFVKGLGAVNPASDNLIQHISPGEFPPFGENPRSSVTKANRLFS